MSMSHTTGYVCALFHVSRQTVSNWADEFARHLSIAANPPTGRHRQFNDDDLEVLALVAQMKDTGMLYADIHASLDNGQRGDIPRPSDLIPAEQRHQVAILQAALHRTELEKQQLTEQVSDLKSKYDKAEGKVELLTEQLNDANQRIFELGQEIARLKDSDSTTPS